MFPKTRGAPEPTAEGNETKSIELETVAPEVNKAGGGIKLRYYNGNSAKSVATSYPPSGDARVKGAKPCREMARKENNGRGKDIPLRSRGKRTEGFDAPTVHPDTSRDGVALARKREDGAQK